MVINANEINKARQWYKEGLWGHLSKYLKKERNKP